jgi:hypothetical protein
MRATCNRKGEVVSDTNVPKNLAECRSLFDATVYRRTHRLHAHGIPVTDDDTFIDCAACGAIDGRIARLQRLQDAPTASESIQ